MRNIALLGIILLIGFIFFSREVKRGFLKNADFDTTVRLQNKIPSRFDELMDDGGIFADPIVSSALVMIVTSVIFLKAKGKRKLLAFAIPAAFLALTIIEAYGKNFVPHPGPPFFMVKHPTTIFPKFTIIQPFSYPSGHASRITFLAIVSLALLKKSKKLYWYAIVAYVLFIAISRIYLGHHWLSDIIGGGLLGGTFGLLTLGLIFPYNRRYNE